MRSLWMMILGGSVAALGWPLTLGGCLACNDVGCGPGFDATIEAAGGAPLALGRWKIEVNADSASYTLECVVGETRALTECEGDPSLRDREDVRINAAFENERMTGWSVVVFSKDEDGSSIEYTGPKDVSITLFFENAIVDSESWEPQYERTHHRGDERCGFCDEAEEVEWSFDATAAQCPVYDHASCWPGPCPSAEACGPTSAFDERGCMRQQCTANADCEDGEVCYSFIDCQPDACGSSAMGCRANEKSGQCECATTDDCSPDPVRYCIAASAHPCPSTVSQR